MRTPLLVLLLLFPSPPPAEQILLQLSGPGFVPKVNAPGYGADGPYRSAEFLFQDLAEARAPVRAWFGISGARALEVSFAGEPQRLVLQYRLQSGARVVVEVYAPGVNQAALVASCKERIVF